MFNISHTYLHALNLVVGLSTMLGIVSTLKPSQHSKKSSMITAVPVHWIHYDSNFGGVGWVMNVMRRT